MKAHPALAAVFLALGLTTMPATAAQWYPSISLGGGLIGAPSAVVWGYKNQKLSVFVRGTNNALWWNTMPINGTFKWAGWQQIGGAITSSPSCVAGPDSSIDCYARAGATSALFMTSYSHGAWGSWNSLGGGIYGAPSATRWSAGHEIVFVRGLNNALFQIEVGPGGYQGAGQFSSDDGVTVTDPGCAALEGDDLWIPSDFSDAAGTVRRVVCYAMGTPVQMFQYTSLYVQNGPYDPGSCFLCAPTPQGELGPQPNQTQKTWTNVAGATEFPASVIYADANSNDVFVTGVAPKNVLFHRAWRIQSGWGAWENLGGIQLASGPSCVRAGTPIAMQTYCFAQAAKGDITMRYYGP